MNRPFVLKQFNVRLTLMVLSAAFAGIGGCGRGPSSSAVSSGVVRRVRSDSSVRIIRTDDFLSPAPACVRDGTPGGLLAPGDIDADDYTDLIVAGGAHPGSLAAFSGKTGEALWRVSGLVGEKASEAGRKPFALGDIMLVGDFNGDHFPDVYARENLKQKEYMIFSGKDGKLITRQPDTQASRPLRSQDFDGDGVADLVFLRGGKKTVFTVLSGKDFKTSKNFTAPVIWPGVQSEGLMPKYPDMNGDHIDEYAVGRENGESVEIILLSGKDFSKLAEWFLYPQTQLARPVFAATGVSRDERSPAVVIADKSGAGPNGETSYMSGLNVAHGAKRWQVLGTELPGGIKTTVVDKETGKTRDIPADVGFGRQILVLPDLSGDGVPELATGLTAQIGEDRGIAVLIFSAAAGEHLTTLKLRPEKGRLLADQMALLDSVDGAGRPGIAVNGKLDSHKSMVVIFALPHFGRSR